MRAVVLVCVSCWDLKNFTLRCLTAKQAKQILESIIDRTYRREEKKLKLISFLSDFSKNSKLI